ncbi:protein boule-like isoform X2 [Melanotaenia boesemani]|uniref:protein boule-like isoform X2 n=1 Tax=Melanotaenia boesemani TaxID=1250792 RepID=UPI001C03DD45|nr:protein boule-like isoform X2 [Melanotaenia boesemani]
MWPWKWKTKTRSSSTPDVLPSENHADRLTRPPFGTVIPNRIFVGGIDYKVNESDLERVFSQYGAVKEVKIVIDRSGMSKRYGFVTFETQEDVLKILSNANGICFEDKKLCIGQAVRKHQTAVKIAPLAHPEPTRPYQMSCGTFYLTTSTGYPYTYHNGVAYFHCPNMNPQAHHWSPAPQLVASQSYQPVHQQPAYHHYQSVPNQCQWNAVQVPIPSSAVAYSHQSEYLYQAADGDSFQPPVPRMKDTALEFVDAAVPQVYPGMAPIILQHDPTKNLMFPPPQVHLKSKYYSYMPKKNHHYVPDTTVFHTIPATHVG